MRLGSGIRKIAFSRSRIQGSKRHLIPDQDPHHCFNARISVADPDPGYGIRCLFDAWIRDPGSVESQLRIRDPG